MINHLEILQNSWFSEQSGAKNITCTFCETSFTGTVTGCSSSHAFAHHDILGRAVLGKKRQSVGGCVPVGKNDDNRYAQFKVAQKVLNKDMMSKAQLLSSSKAQQTISN